MIFSAVIKIIRPINLAIAFFSVLIAVVISSSVSQINLDVFLLSLSLVFSVAAGNIINDVIDFEIDKINKPDRVLPRGLISISFAKGIYILSILFSLILAALISLKILLILIGLNILLLLYSLFLKKVILLSNFTVALATTFPFILGGIIVNNLEGSLIPAGFAFFTNFVREIIKDVEDIEGDSSNKVKTFPQIVGIKKSIYFILALIVLIIILDMFPFILSLYNVEYFVIIMTFVNPIFVYILKLLYNSTDLITLKKSSNLVKVNMILGLIAILIGAQ